MFRSIEDRAVINRLGFNNEGQEAALARLKDRPRGIVGVNLGAGRDSADRIGDYVDGHRAHGAGRRAISPSIFPRPTRRACAISRRPRRSMRCLSRVQDARAALTAQAAAPGQARARSRRRRFA